MMDNIDEITDKRLKALKQIEKDKLQVARVYNKKVKIKSFQVGDLVWKTILPLGIKKQQVWQVIAKLERTVQDNQGYLRYFIYDGDSAR